MLPPSTATQQLILNLDLDHWSEPVSTISEAFSEFAIYNRMIYDRARIMYGQLRELMGDSVFIGFLHDYYSRWALRHVDERAMRARNDGMPRVSV